MDVGNKERTDVLLARIDERTEFLVEEVHTIKSNLETRYITVAEFAPVKNLTYGLVGLICVAVIGALLRIVLRQ